MIEENICNGSDEITDLTIRRATIRLQTALVDAQACVCCLNCEFWPDSSRENDQTNTGVAGVNKIALCTKFDALPPPDVLVHGCEYWDPVIPF